MEIDSIINEFKEVIQCDIDLNKRSEEISKISIFVLNNSMTLFKNYLEKEDKILTLSEIYEVVLHTSPYIGISKSYEFLKYLNENYKIEMKIINHLDKTKEGNYKQIEIFGEQMRDFHLKGDEYSKLINKYLALNCFGDFYTRGILSLKDRELIVFNLLYAMGDAPNQLKSHIKGNLNVGINLLREGLDIPEVSLIAILDADKEGFLRSERSLIQVVGRAARNEKGKAIMYADSITESMQKCIDETNRRRSIQAKYNEENGVIPTTIIKEIVPPLHAIHHDDKKFEENLSNNKLTKTEINMKIKEVESLMKKAAKEFNFEKAIELRDLMFNLKDMLK